MSKNTANRIVNTKATIVIKFHCNKIVVVLVEDVFYSTINFSILTVLVEVIYSSSNNLVSLIFDTFQVDKVLGLYFAFICVVLTNNYIC